MPRPPAGVNGTGNTGTPQETGATGDSASPPSVQNVQGYSTLPTTAGHGTAHLINFFEGLNQPSPQRPPAQPLPLSPSASAQAAGTPAPPQPDRIHDSLPSAMRAAMTETPSVTHYFHQLMSPLDNLISIIDASNWLDPSNSPPDSTEQIHEAIQRAITQCAGFDLGNLHGSTQLAHPVVMNSGSMIIDVLTSMGELSAQPSPGTGRANFTQESSLCAIMRITIHPARGSEPASVSLSPLAIRGKLIKEK